MKRTTFWLCIMMITVITLSVISCSKEGVDGSPSTGQGGSLARFTIAGNYLYAVDDYRLYVYDLGNAGKPEKVFSTPVSSETETIYPYKNFLFLGSRRGFFIYSIDVPSNPKQIGSATHVRACDPVVANDSVAFVTLQGSGACGPAVSGLYIHDIKNLKEPKLKTTIELPNPAGLGLQNNFLYVCCGNAGLKVFDVMEPYQPKLIATKTDGYYKDVIPYNGMLICFVLNGVMLYNITNPGDPQLVREITQ